MPPATCQVPHTVFRTYSIQTLHNQLNERTLMVAKQAEEIKRTVKLLNVRET